MFRELRTSGSPARAGARLWLIALAGLAACGLLAVAAAAPAGAAGPALFKAGAASRTINPDSPQYVGGYGFMEGPTTEVHDDLEVRAFVVGKGLDASVFVMADLTGWFAAYRGAELEPYGIDRTREKIADSLSARGYDIDRSSSPRLTPTPPRRWSVSGAQSIPTT